MTTPTQPPAPAITTPLQWQIGHITQPDGTKVCVLVLTQGLLTTQVALNPHDTDQLGQGLIAAAAQARSGLILPAGAMPPPNGTGGQR